MRIPDKLLALVDAEAKRQRRSRNQMICLALEEWAGELRATPHESIAQRAVAGNHSHDPKSCRIYKCGTCAVLSAR